MKKSITQSILLKNKKYFYTITLLNQESTLFECESAKINQEFLNEDIPALLIDLPNLILDEQEYKKELVKNSSYIRFRISLQEKRKIQEKALQKGYKNVSAYLKEIALS
ncbi:hypothetical protein COB57_01790 [Candidatus Peregrinibacteria bacterium]|nr:MAG: hypothetical protein COB57_01790 [Candidatus Peregrinibacteria bacterium]